MTREELVVEAMSLVNETCGAYNTDDCTAKFAMAYISGVNDMAMRCIRAERMKHDIEHRTVV